MHRVGEGPAIGKNSRERHRAKRRAEQRRRAAGAPVDGAPFGPPGGGARFGTPDIPSQRQIADLIITEALYARDVRRPAELERCRALLADGPGGATGRQVVNRTLFTALLHNVRLTWERGWQPVELVRMARREYTVRHGRLMVDAIAAQMRAYAAATVDPRWQSQLATLGARVWWEHDDHYVDDTADVDRGTTIDQLLDLLYLLRTLPPMERVVPMPGTAAPADAGTYAEVDQRMLDRVRALLAKAESTDFPEEAEAFTAKAQQLMARHSIDHALLAARTGGRDRPATRRIAIDNPYEAPKTLLLQVVAEANRCRAVWMKRYGLTSIVGFPADLDSAELLFTSLLVQATRAMTQAGPRRNDIRSFRQSFLASYATRIGERLNSATEEVDRETVATTGGADLLPVLAARSDAVRDAFEKQFPELTSHLPPINNRDGWVSGRAAADRASLNNREAVTRSS